MLQRHGRCYDIDGRLDIRYLCQFNTKKNVKYNIFCILHSKVSLFVMPVKISNQLKKQEGSARNLSGMSVTVKQLMNFVISWLLRHYSSLVWFCILLSKQSFRAFRPHKIIGI